MIHQFPHEIAYLPRTRLSYISLPGLLSDGKRDRAARVPGFVVINLGESCYLIFLRNGEPFHAARICPSRREGIAMAEVLRLAAEEIDRGEQGSIGYFGAPEAQLRTMLATLLYPPRPTEHGLGSGAPERLFPFLRERGFTGVVELSGEREVHYLCFEDGNYVTGYFCRRDPQVSLGEFVRSIFESAGDSLRVGLFAPLAELPIQASPGLVDLYRRLVQTVGGRLEAHSAADALRGAQKRVARQHPVVTAFEVADDGTVRGSPVTSPEELTDAVAAWLTELLVADADDAGTDPAEVLESTTRDDRFVLAEQGFFLRLPWPIPV